MLLRKQNLRSAKNNFSKFNKEFVELLDYYSKINENIPTTLSLQIIPSI